MNFRLPRRRADVQNPMPRWARTSPSIVILGLVPRTHRAGLFCLTMLFLDLRSRASPAGCFLFRSRAAPGTDVPWPSARAAFRPGHRQVRCSGLGQSKCRTREHPSSGAPGQVPCCQACYALLCLTPPFLALRARAGCFLFRSRAVPGTSVPWPSAGAALAPGRGCGLRKSVDVGVTMLFSC